MYGSPQFIGGYLCAYFLGFIAGRTLIFNSTADIFDASILNIDVDTGRDISQVEEEIQV